jgi:uncharacterized membrane protein YsdA (DUF1294 family)
MNLKRFWVIPFAAAVLLAVWLWNSISSGLLAWLVAINLIELATYGYDKKIAGTGRTRVPELALVSLAFAGGWMLAYVAMRLFHHKTGPNSQDFRNKFWGSVILELVIVAAIWLLL